MNYQYSLSVHLENAVVSNEMGEAETLSFHLPNYIRRKRATIWQMCANAMKNKNK